MSQATHCVKLAWKSFNVDLNMINQWCKANLGSSFCGTQAASELELWFTANPEELPSALVTHEREIVTPTEVTSSVPTLDEDGEPVLDENGDPEMHDETHTEMVTSIEEYQTMEPTGEPSLAQKARTKWAAITSTSAEAVAYTTNAQMNIIKKQVANIQAFSNELLIQFNAENIALGITQDDMTETVLDIMAPVLVAVQSGSPTVAIKRAKEISPSDYDSKYVTAARLLSFINKIEAFIGKPLSTSL